jgi:hypothetical protein
VKVLTKWQAEKKVCWYHWEVVDAACCDCVGRRDGPAIDLSLGVAHSQRSRSFYKAAPDGAEVGDVLPVTEDEWVQLAAAINPKPQEATTQIASETTPQAGEIELQTKLKTPSFAERLERIFRR